MMPSQIIGARFSQQDCPFRASPHSPVFSKRLGTVLLIVATLIASVGCTNASPPSSTSSSAPSDESTVESTTEKDTQAPTTPNLDAIDPDQLMDELEAGMRYGEVRSHLIDQGWIPHDFATTGPVTESNDRLVMQLYDMGFSEIRACSGTGQGFCRFEFVYGDRTLDNGPILVVITTPSNSTDKNHPEPFFYSLRLDDIANTTYIDEPFSETWFNQAQEQEQFCLEVGPCVYGQYALKDALVLTGAYDFGATQTSVIPRTPISPEMALTYAQILDRKDVIDFDDVTVEPEINATTYYEQGIPEDGPPPDWGSVTFVHLIHTDNGDVSEIVFSTLVL